MNYNILDVRIKILDNRFILINSSNTVMADQPFMYAIVIGVFAAFAAVLFTARAKDIQRDLDQQQKRDQNRAFIST